jgi:hypothetical protein
MVIIDGHNLLHTIQKAYEGFESLTDIRLCGIIDRFLKLTSEKGLIIFDGTGPRDKERFESFVNLEVFFAGPGHDADTVIEEKISQNTAPRRLTVVSSDRRLRRAAALRRALPVKSQEFWEQVQKELSRKRHKPEPGAKREGLTEGETQQWLKFFGFEQ